MLKIHDLLIRRWESVPLGYIKVMIGTGAESCITELYYPFEFGYENKTFGYARGLYEDICDTLDIETTE